MLSSTWGLSSSASEEGDAAPRIPRGPSERYGGERVALDGCEGLGYVGPSSLGASSALRVSGPCAQGEDQSRSSPLTPEAHLRLAEVGSGW